MGSPSTKTKNLLCGFTVLAFCILAAAFSTPAVLPQNAVLLNDTTRLPLKSGMKLNQNDLRQLSVESIVQADELRTIDSCQVEMDVDGDIAVFPYSRKNAVPTALTEYLHKMKPRDIITVTNRFATTEGKPVKLPGVYYFIE